MEKSRSRAYNQNPNKQQFRNHRPVKRLIVVLLENGSSFEARIVSFANHDTPICRVFFKSDNNRELCITTNVIMNSTSTSDVTKASVLQSIINKYLVQLHDEAVLDFPEWLEKYSTRAGEANPFFNLDEIREEFNCKKSRFGTWCLAAKVGFFTDLKPFTAKLNKIMHLEIREPIIDLPKEQVF